MAVVLNVSVLQTHNYELTVAVCVSVYDASVKHEKSLRSQQCIILYI